MAAGRGHAPATLDSRLSAVVVRHREAGIEIPRPDRARARDTVKLIRRHLAERDERRGRGPAAAVTVRDLRAITAALPGTLAGTRDRALLLLGFALAARRSELAALTAGDVREVPEGLEVTVRASQTGDGRTVAVLPGTHPLTCPVRAWMAWRAAAGTADGPAFRRVDRHGRLLGGMSGQAVGDVVTRAAATAGLAHRITGHSLRAGLATEARRAGHDTVTIADQGGWIRNSTALYGYLRRVDRWSDNALAGIGL